ncbi:hypothetical protein CKAH01_19009 [Colletotrichum kahawae]|uniref:Uncharacterized protein n=1 Tax=Colletotrichum kahawae TaxID=34407 RepID=A0AAE0CZS7_COLKA|nr:hypothetical protein CKAH01_19009 [Colletotrichum kahawae]
MQSQSRTARSLQCGQTTSKISPTGISCSYGPWRAASIA